MPNIARIAVHFNKSLKYLLFVMLAGMSCDLRAWESDILKEMRTMIIFGSGQNRELNGARIVARPGNILNAGLLTGGYLSTYFAQYGPELERRIFSQENYTLKQG